MNRIHNHLMAHTSRLVIYPEQ